jgi:hypothetical protein
MMPIFMNYFVLKPKGKDIYDPYAMASRTAMRTYANAIQSTNPQLAEDLRDWVLKIEEEGKRELEPAYTRAWEDENHA